MAKEGFKGKHKYFTYALEPAALDKTHPLFNYQDLGATLLKTAQWHLPQLKHKQKESIMTPGAVAPFMLSAALLLTAMFAADPTLRTRGHATTGLGLCIGAAVAWAVQGCS